MLDARYMNAIATTIMIMRDRKIDSFAFANSFRAKQIMSKQWLIDSLREHSTSNPKRVLILGSWYCTVLPYMLIKTYPEIERIDCVDSDPNLEQTAQLFLKLMEYEDKVKPITEDAAEYLSRCDHSEYDLIINTSCEHMPFDMDRFVKSGTMYAFESNNFNDIEEHINCKESLAEFKKSTGLTVITYCGKKPMGGYDRYLVIGEKYKGEILELSRYR
jgi:hypothetical protein